MRPGLRNLLCLILWPVGIPYLLYRTGRSKAAMGITLAFVTAAVIGVSAVPWKSGRELPVSPTADQLEKRPSGVAYRILSDVRAPGEKRSVQVRLPEKVTSAVLQQIAYEIRELDPKQYERTFMMYYLPEMSTDRSAWATTHFTPDLEVAIRGTTLEQDQQVSTRSLQP